MLSREVIMDRIPIDPIDLNITVKKLKSIDSECTTDKGSVHSYIEKIYNPLFNHFDLPKTLVEIGVFNGASLAMFKLALPGTRVIGFDISKLSKMNKKFESLLEDGRIEFYLKDAYSDDFKSFLPAEIDLLIDDGPHTLDSQVTAISYRNKLSDNGILVIEDIAGGHVSTVELMNQFEKWESEYFLFVPLFYNTGRYDDLVLIYSRNKEIIKYFAKKIGYLQRICLSNRVLFNISRIYIYFIRFMKIRKKVL